MGDAHMCEYPGRHQFLVLNLNICTLMVKTKISCSFAYAEHHTGVLVGIIVPRISHVTIGGCVLCVRLCVVYANIFRQLSSIAFHTEIGACRVKMLPYSVWALGVYVYSTLAQRTLGSTYIKYVVYDTVFCCCCYSRRVIDNDTAASRRAYAWICSPKLLHITFWKNNSMLSRGW